jgi:hypothetical protein
VCAAQTCSNEVVAEDLDWFDRFQGIIEWMILSQTRTIITVSWSSPATALEKELSRLTKTRMAAVDYCLENAFYLPVNWCVSNVLQISQINS